MADNPRLHHVVVTGGDDALPYAKLDGVPLTDEPAPSLVTVERHRRRLGAGSADHFVGLGARPVLDAHPARLADLFLDRRRRHLVRPAAALARVEGAERGLTAGRTVLVPVTVYRAARRLARTPYREGIVEAAARLRDGRFPDRRGRRWRRSAGAHRRARRRGCHARRAQLVPAGAGRALADRRGARRRLPPPGAGRRRAAARGPPGRAAGPCGAGPARRRPADPRTGRGAARAAAARPLLRQPGGARLPRPPRDRSGSNPVRGPPCCAPYSTTPECTTCRPAGARPPAPRRPRPSAPACASPPTTCSTSSTRRCWPTRASSRRGWCARPCGTRPTVVPLPLDGLADLVSTELWLRRLLARRGTCWTGTSAPPPRGRAPHRCGRSAAPQRPALWINPPRGGRACSSTSVRRPDSMRAVMYVQYGWRRRSVGEPGFSRRRPPSATVSHGMWLCPKTSTSASGKRCAHRCSRPGGRARLVHDGEAQPGQFHVRRLWQPGAQLVAVVVAVHPHEPCCAGLQQIQRGGVHPVARVYHDVGPADLVQQLRGQRRGTPGQMRVGGQQQAHAPGAERSRFARATRGYPRAVTS